MAPKKVPLREQKIDLEPKEIRIFDGLVFFFVPNNEGIGGIQRQRVLAVRRYGATWAERYDPNHVTHIIAEDDKDYSFVANFLKLDSKPQNVTIVKYHYVGDSIRARKLQDHRLKRYTPQGYHHHGFEEPLSQADGLKYWIAKKPEVLSNDSTKEDLEKNDAAWKTWSIAYNKWKDSMFRSNEALDRLILSLTSERLAKMDLATYGIKMMPDDSKAQIKAKIVLFAFDDFGYSPTKLRLNRSEPWHSSAPARIRDEIRYWYSNSADSKFGPNPVLKGLAKEGGVEIEGEYPLISLIRDLYHKETISLTGRRFRTAKQIANMENLARTPQERVEHEERIQQEKEASIQRKNEEEIKKQREVEELQAKRRKRAEEESKDSQHQAKKRTLPWLVGKK